MLFSSTLALKVILMNVTGGHSLKGREETSLVVQWLKFHASNAGETDSILGQETKKQHVCGAAKK